MTPIRVVAWIAVSTKGQTEHDKISLPEQTALIEAYCAAHDYLIVDRLSVPGHSRSESDIFTAFEELARQGCFAYHKLREHWINRDFDLLLAFDSSRLARSQSLYAFVVENVIRSGASIYLIQGGMLDAANSEFQIALGGMAATSGLKRLVKLTQAGMDARMNRGLSMGQPPSTHRLVRDERGKALRLELRDDMRRLMEDAATLLLEGVGWMSIPRALSERFGHVSVRNGKFISSNFIRRMFLNPYTWGFSARHYLSKEGIWSFDESAPLPEGVEVNRNPSVPIPPAFEGRQAERIKAELIRRTLLRGKAKPHSTYKFTGLLICGECNSGFVVSFSHARKSGEKRVYWACNRVKLYNRWHGEPCHNTTTLRDETTQDQIDKIFKRLISMNASSPAALVTHDPSTGERRISDLQNEIKALQGQINTMILKQAQASPDAEDHYAALISQESRRLITLKDQLRFAVQHQEPASIAEARETTFREVTGDLTAFWGRSNREINQGLHAIMGNYRFVVQEGSIVEIRSIK